MTDASRHRLLVHVGGAGHVEAGRIERDPNDRWVVKVCRGGNKISAHAYGHFFIQLREDSPQPMIDDRVFE